jgi:tetratricopeptide (TPR) repeat protein
VRAADHGSFERIVFDWPAPVTYKVEKQAGRAMIVFARPASLDRAGVQSTLPTDIAVSGLSASAEGTRLELSVPPTSRLRHFVSGNKVVVDIVRAVDAKAPSGSPEAVLAPPVGGDVATPSLPPPPKAPPAPPPVTAQPAVMLPSPALTGGVVPTSTPTAAPAPTPTPVEAAPAADANPPDQVFSLSIAWDKPVAAAVFRKAGYFWIVFDRHQTVDTGLLHRLGGEAVTSIQQFPHRDATVLRLVVKPEFGATVRRDGLLWVVDLIDRPARPKQTVTVVMPANLPTGVGIQLNATDAGNVIDIADPEVGDTIRVVPVIPVGLGVDPGRDTPDVEILPTVQGIALVPHADGIAVTSNRNGVAISNSSGAPLRLSPPSTFIAQEQSSSNGLFNVAAWKRGGPDEFIAERHVVEMSLLGLLPNRRAAAQLNAARYYFANGYAPEALGHLRIAAGADPAIEETGPFRAVRGAAQLLMGHADLAQADLDSPLLSGDAESQFWRAAAHVATDASPAGENKALAAGLPFLKDYPHALKWPLAATAATAAIAAGDDAASQTALQVMDRDSPTPFESPQLDFLRASYDEMAGHLERALDGYDTASESDNREFRARAKLAETELLLKMKKITPRQAADQLDRLRFAWREGDFEFHLLRRYAELAQEAGDYPEALRTLRSLINNYPDDKEIPDVTTMMRNIFATLYLDGGANAMPPVTAIGLYDEFRDLTPSGPKGDEMIRKLADRLAAVDLLDRAADLLKHQVEFRLQGLDKARVGTQLAVLDVLDRNPQAAIDALVSSQTDGLPKDLAEQRRHIQAQALADLNKPAEAIKLLQGDEDVEAGVLRADIYWRSKDWANAATVFESMVPRPERGATLDDASAKLVLRWATALVLGNDERALAALRRNYGMAMEGTADKDGFNLLTSALDRDIPDMPAVASKIKEAENFQSFMTGFRKRMESAGLSAIN